MSDPEAKRSMLGIAAALQAEAMAESGLRYEEGDAKLD
jgi:hypothetical protein